MWFTCWWVHSTSISRFCLFLLLHFLVILYILGEFCSVLCLSLFVFLFLFNWMQANLRLFVICESHGIMQIFEIILIFNRNNLTQNLCIFCFRVQRWFFPYDYQIVQEMHRHEPERSSRNEFLKIRNNLTADEERSYAIAQLPRETSKHTGFAFDSPGYESFFASQAGVFAPQKAWDVARRASMSHSRANRKST